MQLLPLFARRSRLDTRINDRDIKHLNAFSNERKSAVMRRIMSQEADKTVELDGQNDFEKVLLGLRREGYSLIDLQRHEASFWSVWYRKGMSLLGGRGERVIMLLWEAEEHGPHTTVLTWCV